MRLYGYRSSLYFENLRLLLVRSRHQATKPAPGLPAGGTETQSSSRNPSPSPAPGKVTGGKPSTTDLTKTKTTPVSPGGIPKNGESTNQKTTSNHSHKHKGKQTGAGGGSPYGNGMAAPTGGPTMSTLDSQLGSLKPPSPPPSGIGKTPPPGKSVSGMKKRAENGGPHSGNSMASPIGGGKATLGNTKSHSRSLQPPSPIENAKTTSPTGGGKSTSGKSKSHSRSLKPRTPIENTKSSSSVKPVSGMTKRTDNLIKNIVWKREDAPPAPALIRVPKRINSDGKRNQAYQTNPTAKETKPISPKETTPTAKEGKPISPKETKPTSPKESESKESKPTEKKPKKESKTKKAQKDSKPTEKKNKEGDTKESKSKVSDDKKEDAEGSKKAGLKDKVGKLFNTLGL
ncbi:hypothetical protein KEM48_006287 [Puccinia striiformis f. sp. tritici PST-130]|nr:hypothetical protein KEM48_006287 [Puccinia striiformis f. sp. tritici PST-130]